MNCLTIQKSAVPLFCCKQFVTIWIVDDSHDDFSIQREAYTDTGSPIISNEVGCSINGVNNESISMKDIVCAVVFFTDKMGIRKDCQKPFLKKLLHSDIIVRDKICRTRL